MSNLAAAPRGPRGSSLSVRGAGRGGITKRRVGNANGPVRVDRDGDLFMDAADKQQRSGRGRLNAHPSAKPATANRQHTGQSRGGNGKARQSIIRGIETQQVNVREASRDAKTASVQVHGLKSSKASSNPDGGLQALVGFLERKASGKDSATRVTTIKKPFWKGDSVILTASPVDIDNILKVNGFTFAGAELSIKLFESSPPPSKGVSTDTQLVKEKLSAVLNRRYDEELKLLNLSSLGADPGLQQMGLFDGSVTAEKIFPAIMAVSVSIFNNKNNKNRQVISVTLTDNGIGDVKEISALTDTFPGLQNIDMSRNNISDIKGLHYWRNKFRKLENLVVTSNPIEAQLANLREEFLKLFPRLLILNNAGIRTPEEMLALQAKLAAASSPIPIVAPVFIDAGGVGETFIRQFVNLYDTDRTALLSAYYDNESIYSMSINMSAPRTTQIPVHPWAEYLKHSRNLKKLDHLPARMNRQYKGIQQIQQIWAGHPASRHPSLETDLNKYVFECRPLPGLPDPTGQSPAGVDGLIIIIHGEFEEPTNSTIEHKVLRSYSRTFILGPGSPGGPQIRVLSDICALRAWGSLAQPVAPPSQPEVPTAVSTQQQAVVIPLEQQQQQQQLAAKQLSDATGMTIEYSVLCLEQNTWDLARAFDAFTANKANLPPNAFIVDVEL